MATKKFWSIKEIEYFFEQRRIKNEQSNKNYYKAQSQKYLDKINPKTGILYSYEAKIERYKIANSNKIEREKKKAIKAFQEQEKSGFVIAKNWRKVKKQVDVGNNNLTGKITKSKAKQEFQLYSKISRADENGLVREITTGQLVHWRETQGGHYISASVNITCFELNNVWPQFPGSNKIMSMGDQKAETEKVKYRAELIKRIGEEKVNNLEQLAMLSRKWTKVRFGSGFFAELYKKYKALNDEIFAQHPDWSRDKKKDLSWQRWNQQ